MTKARASKSIPTPLTDSIDDTARNAFFYYYVSGLYNTYDVLLPLYNQDRHLIASVDAVSMAFFSYRFKSSRASRISRERYLIALPMLNQALASPQLAKKDTTLLAVLLLDLFEKIGNNNPRSSHSWMSHVNGALALINLGPFDQFQNDVRLRLAVRLRFNLILSCLAAYAPIPPLLDKLSLHLEPFMNKRDPKWQLTALACIFANLQADVERGIPTDIIKRGRELDCEFHLLMDGMPSNWLYHTIDGVDVYPDHIKCQTWNVIRCMRILLNHLMLEKGEMATGYRELSMEIIDTCAKEICATLAQYLRNEPSLLQQAQCYFLIFPLYVAGMYSTVDCVGHLRSIAEQGRIDRADTVASILESENPMNPWSIYAMLGCYTFSV